MNEIYWITRLDDIHAISIIFFVLSLLISVGFLIFYLGLMFEDSDYNKKEINLSGKILKCSIPIAIIMGLSALFVPTTKDAYLIYGVGGTLDYLKSNEKVQKLPDKVVNAIDRYLTIEMSDSIKQNNK